MGDDEAIEEVVCAFLLSLSEPSASTRWATFLTGKLRDYAEVVANEQPPIGLDEDSTVTIGRLVVEPGSGDERIVQLDALHSWSAALAGRPTVKRSIRLSGPVRVLRTGEGWRVANYVRDGRPRAASVVLGPTEWVAVGDLRARVLAVEVGGKETSVDLEVENRSDADTYFGTPWFAVRLFGPLWRFFPVQTAGYRLEVANGEVVRTHVGIERRLPLPPSELRLFFPLVRFGSRQSSALDFRLALRDRIEDAGSASSRSTIPYGLRLQVWVIRLGAVGLVGLVIWWLLRG